VALYYLTRTQADSKFRTLFSAFQRKQKDEQRCRNEPARDGETSERSEARDESPQRQHRPHCTGGCPLVGDKATLSHVRLVKLTRYLRKHIVAS